MGKRHESHELSETEAQELTSLLIDNMEDEQFLQKAGIYYIWGEIESKGLKQIHQGMMVKHLLGPKRYNSDITLVINSPGGDAAETDALLDLISNVRFDVRTVGMGHCFSAGAMLLAAGTKGKRTCGKSTHIMIHPYSSGALGKHQELVSHRVWQDAMYEQDIAFWCKHSKYTSPTDIKKYILKHEDTYFTAKEALKHGIVDSIGDSIR